MTMIARIAAGLMLAATLSCTTAEIQKVEMVETVRPEARETFIPYEGPTHRVEKRTVYIPLPRPTPTPATLPTLTPTGPRPTATPAPQPPGDLDRRVVCVTFAEYAIAAREGRIPTSRMTGFRQVADDMTKDLTGEFRRLLRAVADAVARGDDGTSDAYTRKVLEACAS